MNGDDDERTPDDPVREQLDAMIELAEDRRMLLAREIAIIDADVTRWRSARAVLDGSRRRAGCGRSRHARRCWRRWRAFRRR